MRVRASRVLGLPTRSRKIWAPGARGLREILGFDLIRYIIKIALAAAEQRHIRSGCRQPQSDCSAQPAAHAGHDDSRACQSFCG